MAVVPILTHQIDWRDITMKIEKEKKKSNETTKFPEKKFIRHTPHTYHANKCIHFGLIQVAVRIQNAPFQAGGWL